MLVLPSCTGMTWVSCLGFYKLQLEPSLISPGFIGGVITLPAFLADFDLTNANKDFVTNFSSNVVSVFQAGAVGGALISSPMANGLGRRWSVIINLIIYAIGAAFMTGAQGDAGVGLVYTGRLLTGWAVGASSMITPVYVAECSPAHIRGRLIGLYEVGVQFGTMVSPEKISWDRVHR